MSFFSRLGTLVRGFFSMFAGNLEEKNPDVLFEDTKNQLERIRKQAEQQIIEVKTNAEMIKIEMNNAEKKLSAVKSKIEQAKKQEKKDELVQLLIQEEELQTNYSTHKTTYDAAMSEVLKVRRDFEIFENEMNTKMNELKRMKSQAKLAEFRENINVVNSKFNSENSRIGKINSNIEKIRDIVNRKTAKANAVQSFTNENIDMKINKLDMNSAKERAIARAETMLNEQKNPEEDNSMQ